MASSRLNAFSRRDLFHVGAVATGVGACATARTGKSVAPAGGAIPYDIETMRAPGGARVLEGEALAKVLFPVGGIGTGTISVAGNGDLRDWELFNRPARDRQLPASFVCIRAASAVGEPALRVLRAEPVAGAPAPTGRTRGDAYPHFQKARFEGSYPFCNVAFSDPSFPLDVSFEAWNPMVPLSVDDSSLPVAIFTYRLKNPSSNALDVTLSFSAVNPVGHDWHTPADLQHPGFAGNLIERAELDLRERGKLIGLAMSKRGAAVSKLVEGSFAVAVLCDTVQTATYSPGNWGETTQLVYDYGRHLRDTGRLLPGKAEMPTTGSRGCFGAVAPDFKLGPGQSRDITFLVAWHFPNRENYWHNYPECKNAPLRNDYARRFDSAWSVAEYVAHELPRLEAKTRAFHQALFRSTLPGVIVDAASSQMAILRTNTCMLLDDPDNGRTLYGFEGSDGDAGSFPLNCTHVWNYAQAVAYLYPELERSMRKVDFLWNLFPDDSMAFRTIVPLGRRQWDWYAAADGQMGTVLRLYREWQLSGDREFLRSLWPAARRALEYAWVYWDADQDGVMEGEQHNTYDLEFYGPNTMVGTLYLAALRAMAVMGRELGESEVAARYEALAQRGRSSYEKLFNGEFFIQNVPPAEAIVVPPTGGANENDPPLRAVVGDVVRGQVGNGCLGDQLIGEWLARQLGLGAGLDPRLTKEALRSIFRNNFKTNFWEHLSTDRDFARADERGLLVCTWPRGGRPTWAPLYSDEAWTGVEYQVAAHLIYEGLLDEGLSVLTAVRERHGGKRRNPWNDDEAGDHYARAMASWSALLAGSGFSYSAPDRTIGFAPPFRPEDFSTFFSMGSGWGQFTQAQGTARLSAVIELQHGTLSCKAIDLNAVPGAAQVKVTLANGRGGEAVLDALLVRNGERLRVKLSSDVLIQDSNRLQIDIT